MTPSLKPGARPEPLRLESVKRRARGPHGLLTHRAFRRLAQTGFALYVVLLMVQRLGLGENAEAAATSPEALCPFGGLETMFRYLTSGGKFVPHTHLSNIVLAVAVLITAFLARSAFCGWICPLGFLQEMLHGLSLWVQKKVRAVGTFVRIVRGRGARLAAIDRPLRLLKYGVLVWSLAGAALYGMMVFRDYDPWAALLTIAEFSLGPGMLVLLIVVAASFFVERPWCRYACPLGAASGLVGWLSPVYLKREDSLCKGCALCSKSCPMELDVRNPVTIKSPDCIGCLECVEACPRRGALEVKVGVPVVGQ